jgi:hypothetical protein
MTRINTPLVFGFEAHTRGAPVLPKRKELRSYSPRSLEGRRHNARMPIIPPPSGPGMQPK